MRDISEFKIAISLVNLNGYELLKPAIESLFNSDFTQTTFKLFYWDNGSSDGALEYINGLSSDKKIFENKVNLGITEPRIKLMDAILNEGQWDAVLEIHSDMLFPKSWFSSLLSKFDDRTGILMPYIIQKKEYIFEVPLLESLVLKYAADEVVFNSIAVHPWLLNIQCIKDVGYYNPDFKKHRCEDDDFMLRVLFSEYDIKAYSGSIVFHKGEVIRKQHLKRNKNENIFECLHGISVANFSSLLLKNGDPRIVLDPPQKIKFKNKLRSKLKQLFSYT